MRERVRVYLHDGSGFLFLISLDRSVQIDPDLLTLESQIDFVVSIFQFENPLFRQEQQDGFESFGSHSSSSFEVRIRERVGSVELEEDAGLVS